MPDQHAPAPSWRHRLRRKNHKSEQSSADPPLPGHQGVSSSTGEPQRASEDAKEQQHRDTAGASTVQVRSCSLYLDSTAYTSRSVLISPHNQYVCNTSIVALAPPRCFVVGGILRRPNRTRLPMRIKVLLGSSACP